MIFTLLEAHVAADQWQTLQHAYEAGLDRLPPPVAARTARGGAGTAGMGGGAE